MIHWLSICFACRWCHVQSLIFPDKENLAELSRHWVKNVLARGLGEPLPNKADSNLLDELISMKQHCMLSFTEEYCVTILTGNYSHIKKILDLPS